MKGKNVFNESVQLSKAAKMEPCVFLAHRKADKGEARKLAIALIELGVTIYFDENDECLGSCGEEADPTRLVYCIDQGLQRCTHLLGLITSNTQGSWWVPYEVGATRALQKSCAFLVHKEVSVIPAYMKIAELLPDREALREWVPRLRKAGGDSSTVRLQSLLESITLTATLDFLPQRRSMSTIKFN